MNGVHDLGGMHGFGPVIHEANEPVFHADWERRTFALRLVIKGAGGANVDEFRRSIERMEPTHYLGSSYYERWLHAIEATLVEKGVIAEGELDAAIAGTPPSATNPAPKTASASSDGGLWTSSDVLTARPSNAVTLRHNPKFKARYKVGDRVLVRNLNPTTHTRVPRYVRGHRGVIRHDWGTFVFPDTHAHGAGAHPQHCYGVEFTARELWGTGYPAGARVYVDLWEAYLEAAAPASPGQKQSPAPLVKRAAIVKPVPPKMPARTKRVVPAATKGPPRHSARARAGSEKKR